MQLPRQIPRHTGIATGAFIGCSVVASVLTKACMAEGVFPFPVLVSWLHLLIYVGCFFAVTKLGQTRPPFAFLPPFQLDLPTARSMLPVAGLFVAMNACTMLCLYQVDLTFFPTARSLTVVMGVGLTFFATRRLPSQPCLIALGVTLFSYMVATLTQSEISLAGVIYGVLASAFLVLYRMSVRTVIDEMNDNQWRLLMYNAGVGAVLMFPLVLVSGELKTMFNDNSYLSISAWILILLSGVAQFGVLVAIHFQMKSAPPVVVNAAGGAKGLLIIVVGYIIYRVPVSMLHLLALFASVASPCAYLYLRDKKH